MSNGRKNSLIGITGSIASYKTCTLISALVKKDYNVQVVATESALRFVGRPLLEGLSGHKVHTDLYEDGQAMEHIHLARWADLIIIAPATANYINTLTAGIAHDLLSTLSLAHDFKKPFLIAPAMNQAMYAHPTTRNSIAKLNQYGYSVLETGEGTLACQEIGQGRLIEPEDILIRIERALEDQNIDHLLTAAKSTFGSLKKKRILVTAGGTEEPLDDVRTLTNFSSGETGILIARELEKQGHDVHLMLAIKSKKYLPQDKTTAIHITYFDTFSSFQEQFFSLLKTHSFDFVIHSAAVSDFHVSESSSTPSKLKSEQTYNLQLVPNPKLINQVKDQSINKDMQLIGFKLTSTLDKNKKHESISNLFKNADCDWVIHNDMNDIKGGKFLFNLYSKSGRQQYADSKTQLASKIAEVIL